MATVIISGNLEKQPNLFWVKANASPDVFKKPFLEQDFKDKTIGKTFLLITNLDYQLKSIANTKDRNA